MALTDEQVQAVWAEASAKAKGRVDFDTGLLTAKDGGYPEMWPGYNECVRLRRQILPHVERGHFPDALFRYRAPGQSEEEHQYVKDNYKQTTLQVYLDLENTVSRAWAGDWSLAFAADGDGANKADTAFARYVRSGVREWSSIENFARTALLRPKMADPMGVITVLPEEVPVVVDPDGTERLDTEAAVAPVPTYHIVDDVWGYDYDRWYLVRLPEPVDLEGKTKGVRLLLIDDTNVWTITQMGRANDWEFTITLSYPHGVGEPPCMHLMGVPRVVDGRLIWQTPYAAPAELLDLALMGAQYLEVSKQRTNYPQRVAVGERCDYRDDEHGCGCDGSGVLRWMEGEKWTSKTCPRCGGTGRYLPMGPMKDIVILPPTDMNAGDGERINATNAITYISPSTETMRFSRDEIEHNIRAARSILHLDSEAPMAGADAKTATQAGLDNRSKDAFVRSIADQLFRLLDLILKYTAKEMGASDAAYTLRTPTTYDMRTLNDRVREIEAARTAGMPVFIIARMMQELIAAMYDDDRTVLLALDAISRADRLMYMPREVVATEQAAGRVQPWEAYLHYSPLPLFDAALDELVDALDAPDLAQRISDRMRVAAQAAAPSTPGDSGTAVRILKEAGAE